MELPTPTFKIKRENKKLNFWVYSGLILQATSLIWLSVLNFNGIKIADDLRAEKKILQNKLFSANKEIDTLKGLIFSDGNLKNFMETHPQWAEHLERK